jgi:hypothetical protein
VPNDAIPPLPGTDGEGWTFLIDPAWDTERDGTPPAAAVVGGWLVDADGNTGAFHPNPDYRPSYPDSPTDPVDATLQLVNRGQADPDALLATMVAAVLGIAMDEQGNPLVAAAPDGVPSVLVTTAPGHRARVAAAGWQEVRADELAEVLPDNGIDLLVNPGAPASMRIVAASLKQAVAAR